MTLPSPTQDRIAILMREHEASGEVLSQVKIARLLGVTKQCVHTLLPRMERRGLVRKDGRKWRIRVPE